MLYKLTSFAFALMCAMNSATDVKQPQVIQVPSNNPNANAPLMKVPEIADLLSMSPLEIQQLNQMIPQMLTNLPPQTMKNIQQDNVDMAKLSQNVMELLHATTEMLQAMPEDFSTNQMLQLVEDSSNKNDE